MSRHFGQVTKGAFAGALCLIVSFEALIVRWVRDTQKVSPPSEHFVILTEISKFIICGALYLLTSYVTNSFKRQRSRSISSLTPLFPQDESQQQQHPRYDLQTDSTVDTDTDTVSNHSIASSADLPSTWTASSTVWFLIPTFLYAVSNNITYIALGELSPAMFNLLMNLKIPVTGLLAWWLLSEPITRVQWQGLILMFIGSAIACVKWSSSEAPTLVCSWLGLVLMLVYSSCSGSAAVSIDFITRHRFRSESILLQNVKFSFLGICINLVISLLRGTLWSWSLEPIHAWAVMSMVANGLMTAVVIKYAGSLVKTLSSSFATFPSALLGYLLWHQILEWNYFVGATLCTIAVNLYAFDRTKRHEH